MRLPLTVILALFTFASLQAQELTPPFQATPWKPAFVGIELCELHATMPRLNEGFAAKIDLKAEGLTFFATPGNGDRPLETDGLKTSTYLKKHGLQLAINAAPFGPIHKDENLPADVVGVQLSRGKLISESGADKFPALLFTKDNRAKIQAPPFDFAGIENAVGGFGIVLKEGKVITGKGEIHPRTAAGISADGRTLYLLVIDGRQKDYSLGVTTEEVGIWLKALGASDGINLDGGGTSTLVIENGTTPKVLNRPIHANKPGTERVSASHLGVYAKPLR
jgi:hypothetical protein